MDFSIPECAQSRLANGPTAAPAKMKKPYRKSHSTGALSREDSAPIPAGLGERVRKEGLWEGKSEAGEANGKVGAGMAKFRSATQKLQSHTLLQKSVKKVMVVKNSRMPDEAVETAPETTEMPMCRTAVVARSALGRFASVSW